MLSLDRVNVTINLQSSQQINKQVYGYLNMLGQGLCNNCLWKVVKQDRLLDKEGVVEDKTYNLVDLWVVEYVVEKWWRNLEVSGM